MALATREPLVEGGGGGGLGAGRGNYVLPLAVVSLCAGLCANLQCTSVVLRCSGPIILMPVQECALFCGAFF